MSTIIIPAYNEEKGISKCLQPFLGHIEDNDFEIIVVCNGCKDSTANVVRQLSNKIICLETSTPSKANALNLGDKHAHFYPRVYLDADVVVTFEAILALKAALITPVCAVSLEPNTDLSKSTWLVKVFYDIWLALPYCKAGMVGSGIYAISKKGRSRFDKFPEIIADDGYVRCLYKERERAVAKDFFSCVTAPHDMFNLIKIKTRSRLGRYQLKDKFPELLKNEDKDIKGVLKGFLFEFKLWPKIFVYLSVNLISRVRARYQYSTKQMKWERDDSSRS